MRSSNPVTRRTLSKSPAVDDVHVFTTGRAKQHKEHRFGTRAPKLWWALTSRSWTDFPINVFVIRHRDGLVLFDAGLDPAVESDPNYVKSPIVRFFMRRVFRFEIGPEDSVGSNLHRMGLRAEDVSKVVISHLHFDHIGGIADVRQANFVVSREEWQQLDAPHPDRDYFFREHIRLPGTNWTPIDFAPATDPLLEPFGGCHDLMGDSSLMLLPTPGHTVGSLSMLVRTVNRPPLLLIGDLSYSTDLLMRDQLPGLYADKAKLKASFATVRALAASMPDLVILGSHDLAAEELLRTAYKTPSDSRNVHAI